MTAATEALTWRPVQPSDVAALTELMAAAEVVDLADEHYDEDDVAELLINDLTDLDADTRLIMDGRRVVGFGLVQGQRRVRATHSIWLSGTVDPGARRRGIGAALLAWQIERAKELHADRHPEVEATIMSNASAANIGLSVLSAASGMTECRFWYEMVRRLDVAADQLPVAQQPPGLRLIDYDEGRSEEVRIAHTAAFRDHFGSTERDPDEWRTLFVGSRAFRPELSLLAVSDDDAAAVAGYLLAYIWDADIRASGRREVYVGQLGTLPEERGRGIGSWLLAQAMTRWARDGHQEVWLGVDTGNATGALGLYERAGFTVHTRSASWGLVVPAV